MLWVDLFNLSEVNGRVVFGKRISDAVPKPALYSWVGLSKTFLGERKMPGIPSSRIDKLPFFPIRWIERCELGWQNFARILSLFPKKRNLQNFASILWKKNYFSFFVYIFSFFLLAASLRKLIRRLYSWLSWGKRGEVENCRVCCFHRWRQGRKKGFLVCFLGFGAGFAFLHMSEYNEI